MKTGDIVTYKGFIEGWIGIIVSWGEGGHIGDVPEDGICAVRWYDGSVTDELVETLEVIHEAR